MIFVNAHNVIRGGGINVVLNFLQFLIFKDEKFVAALPNNRIYRDFIDSHSDSNISVEWFNAGFMRYFHKNIDERIRLPKIVKKYNIDRIYSLGNIAFKVNKPQCLLIQNAYAVLDDSRVWERFGIFDRFYLMQMQKKILSNSKFAEIILVQTEVIKTSLLKNTIIGEKPILIAPNVLNVNYLGESLPPIALSGKLKLLFLSKYYPHKNFEIVAEICAIIVKQQLPITITLTLDPMIRAEKKVLDLLRRFEGVVFNLGHISYSDLRNVYKEHHGIFLPSLLESFSSTYLEAMHFNRLVFTSDREFAKEICGEAAFYFNPYSALDIIDSFIFALQNDIIIKEKLDCYKTQLKYIDKNNFKFVNEIIFNSIKANV
jgi:glycosyltransferase involved in cell wall biosynthesis